MDQLGLGSKLAARKGPGAQQVAPAQMPPGARFIQPISECEFTINAALEELLQDAFPRLSEHRPNRCTGTAVQVDLCSLCVSFAWLTPKPLDVKSKPLQNALSRLPEHCSNRCMGTAV